MLTYAGPKGVASTLLEFIDADSSRPHWRDDLAQLPSQTQDALGSMLLTIALRRAVKRKDLPECKNTAGERLEV